MYVCTRLDARVLHTSQIGTFVEENTMNNSAHVGITYIYVLAQCSTAVLYRGHCEGKRLYGRMGDTRLRSKVLQPATHLDAAKVYAGWGEWCGQAWTNLGTPIECSTQGTFGDQLVA